MIQVENSTTTAVNVLLSKLRRCVVLLDNLNISSLHVEDLKECIIVCGMIQGSVLIYGMSLSIVAVGCHQVIFYPTYVLCSWIHLKSYVVSYAQCTRCRCYIQCKQPPHYRGLFQHTRHRILSHICRGK